MKNICVVGVGYVGLVTGTCFAELGNHIIALDINEKRIENLKQGILPIYEPGLKEIVERNIKAQRLNFTTKYEEALKDADFVFICVGTPEAVSGEADLQYVRMAAESIAKNMEKPLIIINKSTVPVGTGDWVASIVRENQPKPIKFSVISCPEFLREGTAIRDFFNPDRTVLGSTDPEACERVAQLHLPLRAPIVVTDLRTAEMIKYASNAFLATRISFINEIANICEALGADVKEVAQGMGYDKRIGHHFLEPGVGYGGSCFEGTETVFALNSPNVAAETLQTIFDKAGMPYQGDSVEVIVPTDKRVLAFDLETGKPTLAAVTAITRRPYVGTMVNIVTSMGRSLRVTADHPVIIRTASGFEIVPANKVAPGDQLMALTELPTVEAPSALNLIDLLRGTELEADVYVSSTDQSFVEQYAQFAKYIPTEMLKYPHEIKQNNRMSLTLFRYLTDLDVLNVQPEKLQLYTAKGAATKINAIIEVDADLLRLCGYYLAEGFISRETGRAGAQRDRIGFSFHENETEYISNIQSILSRYGMKFINRLSTHANTTVVSSRIFAWLIRDVLKCGVRSEDKALPRLVFNVEPELRHELIRGAFSGDGALTTVQDGKNMMLEYATVSKALSDGMTLLLQTLGIVPSIRVRWMNKSTQPAYILRVSGYDQLTILTNVFGEKRREKMETVLAGYQRHIKQRGFVRTESYAALTVIAIEYEQVETSVYSLETSTGTVIASSGLIAHNCFPKDVKALAYMAQVNGTHPELLEAVMGINETQRKQIVLKLQDMLGNVEGKTIGILGLAFKQDTDDIRESPAIVIAGLLNDLKAKVRGYDPVASENVARMAPYIELCSDPYAMANGSDALVVATPWNEFKSLDMQKIHDEMKQPIMIDGRNLYDGLQMKEIGFKYRGVGRGFKGTLEQGNGKSNGNHE
ncbi:MAG: nucleotide sugar dehydrogenase [Chloroflexota bacterium]